MLRTSLDVEATGLNRWRGHAPFSIAFYFSTGEKYFDEWPVDPFTRKVSPSRKQISKINEITMDPSIEKNFWNGIYDMGMCESIGINFRGPIQEVMFMFRCLRSNEYAGLKWVAKTYLGIDDSDEIALKKAVQRARLEAKKKGWFISTKESHPEGEKPMAGDYWLVRDLNRKYNQKDAYRTAVGREFFYPLMEKEKVLETYLEEMRLFPHIRRMENRGIRIFRRRTIKLLEESKTHLRKSEKILFKEAKEKFNPNSKPKVASIMRRLGVKSKGLTEGGRVSYAGKFIKHVKHPFVQAYQEYQSHYGAANQFESYMRNMVREGDIWIIHPRFNQMKAKTHRLSSQWPNLQNVRNERSTGSDVPIKVRSVFGPRPGYRWECNDHSQIEIWILAADANEKFMLRALEEGHIHSENAKKIWPKEFKEGQKDSAILHQVITRAKYVQFGISYGAGVQGIVDATQCTHEEAKQWIDDYANAFPGVKQYQQRIMNKASRLGFIRTLYGRKLMVHPRLVYTAIDYRVQGTGADQMKLDIRKVGDCFLQKKLDAYPVLTIHDDLVNEVSLKIAGPKLIRKVQSLMEDHEGRIPHIEKLPVKTEIVWKSWDKKEPVVLLPK